MLFCKKYLGEIFFSRFDIKLYLVNLNFSTMYRQLWQNSYKSVCSINFYSSSNIEVLGVTGFKVANQIITDDAIYCAKEASHVSIRFYKEDGLSLSASKSLSYEEFVALLPQKNDFEHLGFAIVPGDFHEFLEITGLTLCRTCQSHIGQSVCVIGYQSEYKNMALKTGFVSSSHVNDKGLSFIQYDGTIKPGNSGAPLIDASHGVVLGVVMNKELAISKSYREMTKIIDSNLKVLKEVEGKMKLYDIDPFQVLVASQNQIKHISREFFLNATVKMGLALEMNHIIEYLDEGNIVDIETDHNSQSESIS
jgi:hypothetical protein